jgi:hypothetical protein
MRPLRPAGEVGGDDVVAVHHMERARKFIAGDLNALQDDGSQRAEQG